MTLVRCFQKQTVLYWNLQDVKQISYIHSNGVIETEYYELALTMWLTLHLRRHLSNRQIQRAQHQTRRNVGKKAKNANLLSSRKSNRQFWSLIPKLAVNCIGVFHGRHCETEWEMLAGDYTWSFLFVEVVGVELRGNFRLSGFVIRGNKKYTSPDFSTRQKNVLFSAFQVVVKHEYHAGFHAAMKYVTNICPDISWVGVFLHTNASSSPCRPYLFTQTTAFALTIVCSL